MRAILFALKSTLFPYTTLFRSVRKVADRVRVTIQLIDGETETHVWAERYDRKLDDIFAIQDEITSELRIYRSEEHTSELQSLRHLVCRLLLEKKNKTHH